MKIFLFNAIMYGACSRLHRIQGYSGVLKRTAQQRFVAWLALAAMALIVVMPAVNRAMPMDHSMMGMSSAMDDGHASHAMHARHHAGMPEHPDDPTARCGYCVLFSHMPALGFGAPVILPPVYLATFTPQVELPRGVPAAPLLSAHPRGPPLLVNG